MAYTGSSIVDYLKSQKKDSSYANRAKLAAQYGINNYKGTAQQNTQLLGSLKNTKPTSPQVKPTIKAENPKSNTKSNDTNPINPNGLLNGVGIGIGAGIGGVVGGNKTNANPTMPTYNSPYSKQIDDLLNQVMSNQQFSYDMNSDPMYQQYKSQYQKQADLGMRDAMGNAAALTGGYGSSYAQTAGQQTYAANMDQLNNRIPELYQLAYNKFADNRNNQYNQLNQLNAQEEAAYNKYLSKLDQYNVDRNYNYQVGRDTIADNQWNKQYNYQAGRDNIADSQWNKQYDYQSGRDKITDGRYDKEFEYQRERDSIADSQFQQQMSNKASSARSGSNGSYGSKINSTIKSNFAKEAKKSNNSALNYLDKMVRGGYITAEQADQLCDIYNVSYDDYASISAVNVYSKEQATKLGAPSSTLTKSQFYSDKSAGKNGMDKYASYEAYLSDVVPKKK